MAAKTTPKKGRNGSQPFLRTTSAVVLIIKLGGLALAAHEALFIDPPRDSLVFALAAFMMAGATGLDNIVDRFFGSK